MDLVVDVYEATAKLPVEEKYVLTSQMRRSAVSIPSNIAEGAGRNSDKQFQQFLTIASGSTSELITQAFLTQRLAFLPEMTTRAIVDQCVEISKMNRSLASHLVK